MRLRRIPILGRDGWIRHYKVNPENLIHYIRFKKPYTHPTKGYTRTRVYYQKKDHFQEDQELLEKAFPRQRLIDLSVIAQGATGEGTAETRLSVHLTATIPPEHERDFLAFLDKMKEQWFWDLEIGVVSRDKPTHPLPGIEREKVQAWRNENKRIENLENEVYEQVKVHLGNVPVGRLLGDPEAVAEVERRNRSIWNPKARRWQDPIGKLFTKGPIAKWLMEQYL